MLSGRDGIQCDSQSLDFHSQKTTVHRWPAATNQPFVQLHTNKTFPAPYLRLASGRSGAEHIVSGEWHTHLANQRFAQKSGPFSVSTTDQLQRDRHEKQLIEISLKSLIQD